MKEIKLKIEGMHCEGCSTRLERSIKQFRRSRRSKSKLRRKTSNNKI